MSKRALWKRQIGAKRNSVTNKWVGVKRRPEIILSRLESMNIVRELKQLNVVSSALKVGNATISGRLVLDSPFVWAFLEAHQKELSDVLNQAARNSNLKFNGTAAEFNSIEKLKSVLVSGGKDLPEKTFANVSALVGKRVFEKNIGSLKEELKTNLKDYLVNKRGLLFDSASFELIAEPFINLNIKNYIFGHSFPLHELEQLYISLLKSERGMRIDFGHLSNQLLRAAFRGRKVPLRVVKEKRDWLVGRIREIVYQALNEAKLEIKRKYPNNNVSQSEKGSIVKKFVEELASERVDKFLEVVSKRLTGFAEKFPIVDKKKRVATGQKDIKVSDLQRERKVLVGNVIKAAVMQGLGVAFDSFQEVRAAVYQSNNGEGRILDSLVSNRHISTHAFSVLHSNSHLGEALFFQVMSDNNFIEKFGLGVAEPLARLFSYISAQGRVNETVLKRANKLAGGKSKRGAHLGTKMVEFLIHHNYFDPTHTGNKVTYLVRLRWK